jgi:hypothetical protein
MGHRPFPSFRVPYDCGDFLTDHQDRENKIPVAMDTATVLKR